MLQWLQTGKHDALTLLLVCHVLIVASRVDSNYSMVSPSTIPLIIRSQMLFCVHNAEQKL